MRQLLAAMSFAIVTTTALSGQTDPLQVYYGEASVRPLYGFGTAAAWLVSNEETRTAILSAQVTARLIEDDFTVVDRLDVFEADPGGGRGTLLFSAENPAPGEPSVLVNFSSDELEEIGYAVIAFQDGNELPLLLRRLTPEEVGELSHSLREIRPTPRPAPRESATMVSVGGAVAIVGGLEGAPTYGPRSDIWGCEYSREQDSLSCSQEADYGSCGNDCGYEAPAVASSCGLECLQESGGSLPRTSGDSSLLVYGGSSQFGNARDGFVAVDLDSGAVEPLHPPGITPGAWAGGCSASSGEHWYLVGGVTNTPERAGVTNPNTWRWSFAEERWTALPRPVTPSGGGYFSPSCQVVRIPAGPPVAGGAPLQARAGAGEVEAIVLFGGSRRHDVVVYDIERGAWSFAAPVGFVPPGRSRAVMLTDGQRIWIVGGFGPAVGAEGALGDIWEIAVGYQEAGGERTFTYDARPVLTTELLPRIAAHAGAWAGTDEEGGPVFVLFGGFTPDGGGQVLDTTWVFRPGAATDPEPPEGAWLTSPAVPGFEVKVRITGGGDPIAGSKEGNCIPETLCVSGALAGRSEVFVRVVGPKPNEKLWPTLVKFSTAQVEVWLRQAGTGIVRYYRLPAVPQGETILKLDGLAHKLGFDPPAPQATAPAAAALDLPPGLQPSSLSLAWLPDGLLPALAASDPTPPAGPWLESSSLAGYRVKVRITGGGGAITGSLERNCIAETLCVSGALAGRSEVFVRVVGPKPNQKLWPTLVKFSTSRVEVWIEQKGSGTLRYYDLPAVSDGGAFLTLDGLADKLGFDP